MEKISAKFWWRYHIGMIMFCMLAAIGMKYKQLGSILHPNMISTFFIILSVSLGVGYLTMYMVRRFAQYNKKRLSKIILPALFIYYVVAFLIANVSVSIGVWVMYIYHGRDMSTFWHNLFKYELSFANGNFLSWLLFFTVAFFYIMWNKANKKEQKLNEENLKYKYNTLKAQVNPHFLFNSLNTLSELVHVDAQKSDLFIQKLSKVYRYILENENNDWISLERELDFVKQYFDLQLQRNQGNISMEINIENPEKWKVIPVSVQLLVENAIKHNQATTDKPLHIWLFVKDEYIGVENTLQRKDILENSMKTGLQNLKERVSLTTEKQLIIKEDNQKFLVMLPVENKD
ncbi:sensor histidine kinase [Labilibacter marinus]|uniref:sensor histidine kinase n=1 Tax=Labilibacter marinus TaxID=1477105 RepID=UPI00083312D8|nr:sensor histidine kinase [Labilibacter marinus]